MAESVASLADLIELRDLINLCSDMVDDSRVPYQHKRKMQEILKKRSESDIGDDENREFENHPKVWFLCDGRACKHGCNRSSDGSCRYTSDVSHAAHFQLDRFGNYAELDMNDDSM